MGAFIDRLRLRLALAMISLVRFVVPRRQRDAWLAEWRGELLYLSSAPPHEPPSRRPDVLAHSLHAIPHAAAHFRHERSPEILLQDLRYAVRRLVNAPGFAAVAMLTIALGVGANAAIFSVIDSTLIHPLPYPDADRLVFLWKQAPEMSLQTTPTAEDIRLWRERVTSFEEIQVYSGEQLTLTGGDEPRQLIGLRILPGFFAFLGARPALGREFSDEEAGFDERVAVLSYGLWRSHFGGADDVLGRKLVLDEEAYTVVGVMPREFRFQAPFDDAQLYLPLSIDKAAEEASPFALARLHEGVHRDAANEELAALAAASSEGDDALEGWRGVANRPQDLLADRFRTSLLMMQAAVAIVLLIACANVANLLLARGSGQSSEMAVRAALGASRSRIFRQALSEHVVLALGGGLVGYGLARGAVAAILLLRPEDMSALASVRVDGWIFFFAMGVAALTGALFGVVPALQVSRPNVSEHLRQASGSGAQIDRGWLRSSLVVAEVALALLLLVGAGLLFGSLSRLVNVDLGFDTRNVLTMTVSLPDARYPDEVPRLEFRRELESRIRQVAGDRLRGIALASGPLPTLGLWFGDFAAEGEDVTDGFTNVAAHSGQVSPGYLSTLGVRFVAGRDFIDADVRAADNPVIVNATWARRMWGEDDVVGRRFWIEGDEEPSWFRVVGVTEDAMLVGPVGGFGDLQVFRPREAFASLSWIIRTVDDPGPLADAIKEQVWAIDPDLPISNVALLEQVYSSRLASQRFSVALLGAFAALALALALIGVYGVLSYTVGRRTREIGIRVALGARRQNVVPMIAWQGMRPVLVGVVTGAAGAMALTRFIESLLYEVSAVDPVTYVSVSLALIVVAALACLAPAMRAARLDAMEALRQS